MVLIKSSIKGQKDCIVLICNEEVKFNTESIAEVSSQEKAEEIVSKFGDVVVILDKAGNEPGNEEVKNTSESSLEGNEDSKKEEDVSSVSDDTNTGAPEGGSDDDEIDLNELNVEQMKDLCKSAELPAKEYKSLKRDDLIAYIEEKIK